MFVPVACSACGKPFQVPEGAIGQQTTCPWCQAAVLALPIGQPAPATLPSSAPEPLPLDDHPPPGPGPARRRLWVHIARPLLIAFLAIAGAAATFAVLRYKEGLFITPEWRAFTAPDGSCRADLLGHPVEEGEGGEKRYVSEGWYSGIRAWIGWRDLTQLQVQQAAAKDGWVSLLPLFAAEGDRLKEKYGGTVIREATRPDAPMTHEVRLESPDRRVIERMIVKPDGPRPRIYFVGIAGKNLDLDGHAVQRLFDSFRVIE